MTDKLAETIWNASRADEGTISATGANHVAKAVRGHVLSVMGDNWKVFMSHRPIGTYLPHGQLDGDCRDCGDAWPCPSIKKLFGGMP